MFRAPCQLADIPFAELRTPTEQIDGRSANERLLARMSAVVSVLALVLAGIGIYGIVA